MAKALINIEVLQWAMSRADMQPAALGERLKIPEDQVEAWLTGDNAPTFVQARNAAAALSVPFGYLYLPKPPEDDVAIPDLRTVNGERIHADINLKSLLSDIGFKRDWFREYRERNGYEALGFIGRFGLDDAPENVAADMTKVVVGEAGRPRRGGFEDYLQFLMLRAETIGIWVMRTGIVGNNTHRALAVSQFRGLAIADDLVPLILINGQDTKSAQIFTFAHELAHLWLGQSAVSNVDLGVPNFRAHRDVEQYCNSVAAEFLTPKDEFQQQWQNGVAFLSQVDRLAAHFKVSRVVIARRGRDLGSITAADFGAFYAAEQSRWQDLNRDKGGDFFNTLPVRNGRQFTRTVIGEAMRGNLLLRHAGSLLGIQPGKIRKMYERLAS